MSHTKEHGFTAVELLITLFIAVAFIATGYQLYGVIVTDGGKARQQARANNIAYDNLRKYAASYHSPCAPTTTPSPTPAIPSDSGLANATIQVTISCPYGNGSSMSKINVTVKYGNPQEEVAHAIYSTN